MYLQNAVNSNGSKREIIMSIKTWSHNCTAHKETLLEIKEICAIKVYYATSVSETLRTPVIRRRKQMEAIKITAKRVSRKLTSTQED
jgi:hypothetical protein